MTQDELSILEATISALSEEQREDLDEIVAALHSYIRKYKPRRGGFVIPNRIAALAATQKMYEIEKLIWKRP